MQWLLLFVVLIGGWLFCIAPRRNHPPKLKQLQLFRYAHRGYHDKPQIPENSMAAFRQALRFGYGVELDVHLSRDGRLVVMHDESLQRTCGVDREIADLTAEELKQYHLEGTMERIPFLEEVLPLFAGKTPLIVELKATDGNAAALSRATMELLDQYPVDYCIESFHPLVVAWFRKNRPDVIRGQLSGRIKNLNPAVSFVLRNLLTNAVTRPDFVAYRFADRRAVSFRLCRKMGAAVFYWTIRTKAEQYAAEADSGTIIFEQFEANE
ncbi:MAG: glycerophosphodiester phosphodiesterase family protein [Oscillospiraceae bacterium]|jgi:glycerophosphoryl diester phosphodiesterase